MSTSSKYLASPQIQLKNNKSYRTLLTAETSSWYVTATIWSPPICKLHLWITWQPIHGERAPISISVQQATGDAFCTKLNPSLTFHLTCPSSAQQLGGVAHNAPLPSSTFLFFSLSLSAFLSFRHFLTCCKSDCGCSAPFSVVVVVVAPPLRGVVEQRDVCGPSKTSRTISCYSTWVTAEQ